MYTIWYIFVPYLKTFISAEADVKDRVGAKRTNLNAVNGHILKKILEPYFIT